MKSAPDQKPITAYKGFDKNLKCRDFQYAIGKTYKHDGIVELCGSGFHACPSPLDVFSYYPPADSVYAVVEQSGEIISSDDKTASSVIQIKASLSLAGLISAHVDFVMGRIKKTKKGACTADWSAATNTGNRSAATNTGDQSAATNTGKWSAATNTGDQSAATVEGKESVAIVTGYESKAKASLGSWIVLTERNEEMEIINIKSAKAGDLIKPDVFYTLVDGEIIEAK